MPPSNLARQPSNFARQPATWATAFFLGITLGRWLRRWFEKRQEALSGVVSESSRLVAAWRAVESLEVECKLFNDPLAAELAGHPQFVQALAAAQPIALDAEGPPRLRLYRISNIAARTWWFDRQLAAALSPPPAAASSSLRWLPARLSRGQHSAKAPPPPRQVVALGSGMDTRPWRLPLPSGVRWFEVDQAEVLAAKRRTLERAGTQLSGEKPARCAHPLLASSWTAVAADLSADGWVEELASAGLDLGQPVVWVTEGLLMYLPSQRVAALLHTLGESSAAGSVLVAHSSTDEFIARLRRGEDVLVMNSPFPRALMDTWVSGLPTDPAALLQEAGWKLQLATTRAVIAAEICVEQPGGQFDFSTVPGEGTDGQAVFIVATK